MSEQEVQALVGLPEAEVERRLTAAEQVEVDRLAAGVEAAVAPFIRPVTVSDFEAVADQLAHQPIERGQG